MPQPYAPSLCPTWFKRVRLWHTAAIVHVARSASGACPGFSQVRQDLQPMCGCGLEVHGREHLQDSPHAVEGGSWRINTAASRPSLGHTQHSEASRRHLYGGGPWLATVGTRWTMHFMSCPPSPSHSPWPSLPVLGVTFPVNPTSILVS